jgi:hypothetical protein
MPFTLRERARSLEHEIPKYDADLRKPNIYACSDEAIVEKKVRFILDVFRSQSKKQWFDKELRLLLRIREVECNSPSRYAEAFCCRKMLF